MKDLAEHPPGPMIVQKKPRKEAKGKGKGNGKDKGKGEDKGEDTSTKGKKRKQPTFKDLKTPQKLAKGGASFKRKAGFNRKAVTPMAFARSLFQKHKIRKAAGPLEMKPVAEGPVPVAEPEVSQELMPDSFSNKGCEKATFNHFLKGLHDLGVPRILMPSNMPSGGKSYTVKPRIKNGPPWGLSSVQVLHTKGMYYITVDKDGNKPSVQTHSWNHHGGATGTWEYLVKNHNM